MQKHIIALFCAAGMVVSAPVLAASKLKVKPNAPARYVVKQGDTLWNISGKYLYRPWQWPALWNVNRSKVRNPHLIYPGQELYLTYVNGRPVLRAGKGGKRVRGSKGGIPTIKLGPQVIDMGSGYGIPTINVDFYRLFMKHPQFVSEAEMAHAPRIVAGADSRTLYTSGDRIYADGPIDAGDYLIFRVRQDLKDPVTGKSLGKLVEFGGEASTVLVKDRAMDGRDEQEMTPKMREKLGEDEYYTTIGNKRVPVRTAQPMTVTTAVSEVMKGDYLLPKPEVLSSFYMMPHAPENQVEARIVTMMDGISESSMGQTVILNKGEADGIDPGTVLSIYKPNRLVKSDWNSPDKKAAKFVNLPTEEVGLAMVYRTGENVSSAIVLESTTNVNKDDILREPGQGLDTSPNPDPQEGNMIEKQPGLFDDADLTWEDVVETVK